jgi:hypothetical protein
MNNREIKKCVSEILDSLCNRKGFDDWWYNLDEDIEQEIESELEEIIKQRLNKDKDENNGIQTNRSILHSANYKSNS